MEIELEARAQEAVISGYATRAAIVEAFGEKHAVRKFGERLNSGKSSTRSGDNDAVAKLRQRIGAAGQLLTVRER